MKKSYAKKLIIVLSLLTSSFCLPIPNVPINELEFYVDTVSCIPKYFYCKNNLLPSNPDLSCLEWGQCQHLQTLEALIQTNIVQEDILKNDKNLTKNLNTILKQYGKDSLASLLDNYSANNIKYLINDILSKLSLDESVLQNAGINPEISPSS